MLVGEKAHNRDKEVEKLSEVLSLWGWKDESYSYIKKYKDGREEEKDHVIAKIDSFNNKICFWEGNLELKNKTSYYNTSISLGENLILATTKEYPSFRSNILLVKAEEVEVLYFYENKEAAEEDLSKVSAAAILIKPSLVKNEYTNPLVFSFDVFETTRTQTRVYAATKAEALEMVKKYPERFKYNTTIEKTAIQAVF